MTSMRTLLVSAALSALVSATGMAGEIQPGNLIFPNNGLNAIQEYDPNTKTIAQTIPLPAPYTYDGPGMLSSALVRNEDHSIVVNVRGGDGSPQVLVLSATGQFVSATAAGGGNWLQQIQFDPVDRFQHTVLGGTPFLPEVRAIDLFTQASTTRISRPGAGNFIGLEVNWSGHILAGDYWTGEILEYLADGTPLGVFADVLIPTGSNEINGMTIDGDGNLYVAQNNSQHLVKFDADGSFLGVITAPSFHNPGTVFYNLQDDLLYVGNGADGQLTIMQTNGFVVDVVDLGGWGIGTGALVTPIGSDRNWSNSAGGAFGDPGNWLEGTVPALRDRAWFGLASATPYVVTLAGEVWNQLLGIRSDNVSLDLGGHVFTLDESVVIGRFSGDQGTLVLANGTLASGGPITVGQEGVGHFTVTGSDCTVATPDYVVAGWLGTGTLDIGDGAVVTNGHGRVGWAAGADGAVAVSGTGTLWRTEIGALEVGSGGQGTLTVSDGARVESQWTTMGSAPGGVGAATVTGAGSSWDCAGGGLAVGWDGHGTLHVTEGGVVTSADAFIGRSATAIGEVDIDGAGSRWSSTGGLNLGWDASVGILHILNGGVAECYLGVNLGTWSGSTGEAVVSGAGSQLSSPQGPIFVGRESTGTLIVEQGATATSFYGFVGLGEGSNGQVRVKDVGSRWDISDGLTVGQAGSGILHITKGGQVAGESMEIGIETTGTGVVTASGIGSTLGVSGYAAVGHYGDARLTIAGGAQFTVGEIAHGAWGPGSTATIRVRGEGSTWNVGSTLDVAEGGQATMTIEHRGSVTCGRAHIGNAPGSNGTAIVRGAGSSWNILSEWVEVGSGGQGTLRILNGGRVTNGMCASVGTWGSGTGQVLVQGDDSEWTIADSLSLGAAESGSGELTVSRKGRVSARNVTVHANGVLRGDATVAATEAVANGGRVEPGTSIGRLTIDGDYVQQAAGTLAIELGGRIPGKKYDHLQVTGTALLGGTLHIARVGGFNPRPGQEFVVLTADSIIGRFDSIAGEGGFAVDYGAGTVTLRFVGSCARASRE